MVKKMLIMVFGIACWTGIYGQVEEYADVVPIRISVIYSSTDSSECNNYIQFFSISKPHDNPYRYSFYHTELTRTAAAFLSIILEAHRLQKKLGVCYINLNYQGRFQIKSLELTETPW